MTWIWLAVGNVVGSNLFNLMCVLGITSAAIPSGIPVGSEAVAQDLPVMVLVAVSCLPSQHQREGMDHARVGALIKMLRRICGTCSCK